MTAREKKLVIVVGIFILGWFVYYYYTNMMTESNTGNNSNIKFVEAQDLIKDQVNIVNRYQRVTDRLNELQKQFFTNEDPKGVQSDLLKEIERIARDTQLNIQQKNIINFADNLIGVTIEGKTGPESLIRFMQQTTEARYYLKIQRIQVHVLTESKQLSFQITLSSLLVPKNEQ